MGKPNVIRPAFYAQYLPGLQELARTMGYNLLIHGSLNRDLDLVAVPWTNDPRPEIELIREMDKALNGKQKEDWEYMHSILPGGRSSYVIDIWRMKLFSGDEDQQFYLDISITPLVKKGGEDEMV